MKLNYTLKQLAEITNGLIIGDETRIVDRIVIDSRRPIINQNTLFVALKGYAIDGHEFCESFVSKSGGTVLVEREQNQLKSSQLIVKDTVVALQLIAKHYRQQFNIPVIGITGSNGKTTVKEWLFHTLKSKFNICRSPKSYNSQLGVALSVFELNSSHTLAIFEAGISHNNEMQRLEGIIKPTIGVFTELGDAHQENFTSIEHKRIEKFKLFDNVNTLIQNGDELINLDIPFTDLASIRNANLVFKTAMHLGLDKPEVLKQLTKLPPISMRMERMQGVNGNIIINDVYTLDDKSLEIGVNYLNKISERNKRTKIIIIAPKEGTTLSNSSIELLNSEAIDKIILIGEKTVKLTKIQANYLNVKSFIDDNVRFNNSNILITGARNAKLEKIVTKYLAKKHITKLTINLPAIRNNLDFYRTKLNKETLILAMVKAQSYGGGIVQIAQFLETQHVNYFGVAYTDEGVVLRNNDISTPIIVMNPEADAFNDIIDHELEPSIYSLEILDEFISALIRKNINSYPIHLKLDTGMNRLGFVEDDLNELMAHLNAQPEVYVKSVFSHLSVADDLTETKFTEHQISTFKDFSNRLKTNLGYSFVEHIANSAGTLNYPNSHFDMVRLGIGMYGLMNNYQDSLETVLSFETQISQIKRISNGSSVGYGRSFIADTDMTIAIVPVGYADGLRRELGNGNWSFVINGQMSPIIGNVCMDMCMVDISNLDCKVGDRVQIFGEHNSVSKMANVLHTIQYEVISLISSRVHRVYLGLT